MRLVLVAFCFLCALATAPAASTVDFADFTAGDAGPIVSFDHGVLVETSGGTIIVYAADGPLAGACPRGGVRDCRGDLSIIFFGPVTNLSFSFSPSVPTGSVAVTLFDGETVVLSGVAGGASAPLSTGSAPVTRASLSFSNVGRGTSSSGGSLGTISYDTTMPTLEDIAASLPEADTSTGPVEQTRMLDFRQARSTANRPRSLRLPGATVTLTDGRYLFLYGSGEYGMPATGGFCAIDEDFRCMGDVLIVFDQLIRDLSFDTFFYKPGDRTLVRLFSGETLLDERLVAEEGNISFFGVAGITHIELLDRSNISEAGLAYGNFRYAIYEPTPVPVPASALLLASGLALVAGLHRRRRPSLKGPRE